MLDNLLRSLKPKQLTAVQHSEGPLLIIAGAGTGKTTTITAKIAHMVEKVLLCEIEKLKIILLYFYEGVDVCKIRGGGFRM